jgi:hypothetical protein
MNQLSRTRLPCARLCEALFAGRFAVDDRSSS